MREIATASCGMTPSGPDPVVRRDAHRDRLLVRPHLAHRVKHFEREAHAVVQAAAVFVGAPVGQRRDEGRHQVAVRVMQLEPIEAGARRHFGGAHELVAHRVHVGARHFARHLVVRAPRHARRRRSTSQLFSSERRVRTSPSRAGSSPSRPEWPSWMAILASVSAWTKSTSRFQALLVLVAVEAGAAGRDAAFRRHAGHLGEHQAGAALGALGIVHEMPVVRRAVDCACTAPSATRRRGWQVRRRARGTARTSAGAPLFGGGRWRCSLEPFLGAGEPLRIALAQVLVADALRARQQRIVELHRIEMEIALDVLEPFGRIARRVLQPQHFEPALVSRSGAKAAASVGLAVDVIGERDGAFHRQLRAGADREMRGRGGIAEQHDVVDGSSARTARD